METSSDYKKWTSDSNSIPASSPVVVSQYANAKVSNLVWTTGATGGALSHSHTIPSDSLSLSVAALRQAYAAQKYKEIQLANDVNFGSQIEAHFGVKPKHADDTSYFIGGSSSMIDINPIVNQNLSGDGQANYKAFLLVMVHLRSSLLLILMVLLWLNIVTGKQIGRAHV